jgi:hypothetical protein
MTANSREAFDRAQAVAERARLQQLLDDYEAGRVAHEAATESGDEARQMGPDRAGKVRARIAGLDEVIGNK